MNIYRIKYSKIIKTVSFAVIVTFLCNNVAFAGNVNVCRTTLSPESVIGSASKQLPMEVALICGAIEKKVVISGKLDIGEIKKWIFSEENRKAFPGSILFQDLEDEVQVLAGDGYLIRYSRRSKGSLGVLFGEGKSSSSLLVDQPVNANINKQIYKTELLFPRNNSPLEVFEHIHHKSKFQEGDSIGMDVADYLTAEDKARDIYAICRTSELGWLFIHPDFLKDYEDIRRSGMGFAYTFEDGVTRWIDLAEAVAYRAAMHEMDLVGRKGKAHFYKDERGKRAWWNGGKNEKEANYVGRRYSLVDDAIWLWFLHSYKMSDAVRYSNSKFLQQIQWIFYDSDEEAKAWRDEFPALAEDPEKLEEAVRIALDINRRFFEEREKYGVDTTPAYLKKRELRERDIRPEMSDGKKAQEALGEVYKRVLSGKKGIETKEEIDITPLIQLGSGKTQRTFIQPNGKPTGKSKGIGLPKKGGLKAVSLEVIKGSDGKVRLIFKARTVKDEKVTSIRRWSGEDLLPEKISADEVITTLRKHSFDIDAARKDLGMRADENFNDYLSRQELSDEETGKIVFVLLSHKTAEAAGGKEKGGPGNKKAKKKKAEEDKEAVKRIIIKHKASFSEDMKKELEENGVGFKPEDHGLLGLFLWRYELQSFYAEFMVDSGFWDEEELLKKGKQFQLGADFIEELIERLRQRARRDAATKKPGNSADIAEKLRDEYKRQGTLELVQGFADFRPREFGLLLSLLSGEHNFDLDEINRIIKRFRELNLGEVASARDVKSKYIDFADLFIKTVISQAVFFAKQDEKTKKVFLQLLKRSLYRVFSKNPKKRVAELQRVIHEANEKGLEEGAKIFLERVYREVEAEFITIPDSIGGTIGHIDQSKKKLTAHQLVGIHTLRQNNRFALLDGTRTGKTLQVLAAMDLKERTLVVSPAGVMDTWYEAESESFSGDINIQTIDASDRNMDSDLESLNEEDHLIVLLRGNSLKRDRLLKVVRGRKKTIIHVSFETLREMSEESLELLKEALDGIVIDEWQYAENYLSREREINSQQAAVVQTIKPLKRWVISASPYRSDPRKLFAMFHYLRGDEEDALDWVNDGRVFSRSFAENMEGLRWLSGELAEISLRRAREDVWDIYEEGMDDGNISIPHQGTVTPWRWEMPVEMSRQAIGMIKNFRSWVVDVFNPAAPEDKRITKEQLTILTKIRYLRWLSNQQTMENDGLLDILDIETPYWDELRECVEGVLEDPEKKVVIFTQNIFMVEELLERYKAFGCVRIDGEITGFKKNDVTGHYERTEKGRRITNKSWNRKEFQENPEVRICVANINAGVGIDLSRGDAVIYAQMPETHEQLYQSKSRILGPNQKGHLRKKVDMYFMCSEYSKELEEELELGQEYLYYKTGTVDQVQYDRLQAQKAKFGIIMDGGVSDIEKDEDPLQLIRHLPHYIGDLSIRESTDLSEKLSQRQRMIAEMKGYLGNLIYIASIPQREAIYKIIMSAYKLKADLKPLSKVISELERFNQEDLIYLARLTEISNNYFLRDVYSKLPEFLTYLYGGKTALEAKVEDVKIRHGSGIKDYVIVAALAFLFGDEDDLHEKRNIFFHLAGEISVSRSNKQASYSELLMAINAFNAMPVKILRHFRETGNLAEKLNILKGMDSILSFTDGESGAEVLMDAENSDDFFDELAGKVQEARTKVTVKYFREKFGINTNREEIEKIKKADLDSLRSFIGALERGRRAASTPRESEKFSRELERFGEIVSRILDGTYYEWRNRQSGSREHGMAIEYLEEEGEFWETWTKEEKHGIEEMTVEADYPVKKKLKEMEKLELLLKGNPGFVAGIEGEEVGQYFSLYMSGKKDLAEYKRDKKKAGMLYNKIYDQNPAGDERGLLEEIGIDPGKKKGEVLDELQKYLRVLEQAMQWIELFETVVKKDVNKKLKNLLSNIYLRTSQEEGGDAGEFIRIIEALMKLEEDRKERKYKNVEIKITSDPYEILRRGMPSRQLMNCFEHGNNPSAVRLLIDDLGSRNKMLVTVKAEGQYQAVAIAKIKKRENGQPVIFLERILARAGEYDFEAEMLKVLFESKSFKMPLHPDIAVYSKNKNDPELISTGGYDEDEYSEAHFQVRPNYYIREDGPYGKNYYPSHGRIINSAEIGAAPQPREGTVAQSSLFEAQGKETMKKNEEALETPEEKLAQGYLFEDMTETETAKTEGITKIRIQQGTSHIKEVVGIGHGSRKEGEFIDILKSAGVTSLVDIRSRPHSRFNPQFNRKRMEEVLKQNGIEYIWMGDNLGGLLPEYNGDFKKYMEENPSGRFINAMRDLFRVIFRARGSTAILCSETMPDKCHRVHILDFLEKKCGVKEQTADATGGKKRSGPGSESESEEEISETIKRENAQEELRGVYERVLSGNEGIETKE
ncbi:MAG: DUF488 family protein, partial [Candidatus Omnitrophota bacterium]